MPARNTEDLNAQHNAGMPNSTPPPAQPRLASQAQLHAAMQQRWRACTHTRPLTAGGTARPAAGWLRIRARGQSTRQRHHGPGQPPPHSVLRRAGAGWLAGARWQRQRGGAAARCSASVPPAKLRWLAARWAAWPALVTQAGLQKRATRAQRPLPALLSGRAPCCCCSHLQYQLRHAAARSLPGRAARRSAASRSGSTRSAPLQELLVCTATARAAAGTPVLLPGCRAALCSAQSCAYVAKWTPTERTRTAPSQCSLAAGHARFPRSSAPLATCPSNCAQAGPWHHSKFRPVRTAAAAAAADWMQAFRALWSVRHSALA